TMLRRIRSAVINQRRLRFTYHTRHVSDDNRNSNRREVDPYGLIHHQGKWYLVAHCHLREGLRNFRLERIDDLETLLQSFQRPADFTLREQEDDRDLIVRVYFDHAITRWVLEEPSFFQESIEHVGDDLLVTYRVRQIDEIKGWLLSWGARARVLEPETLRKALANEAHAILANYESEKSLLP
ncbi:MAG: WYL domain-containing protein, partial [Chloroflexota bacterium]